MSLDSFYEVRVGDKHYSDSRSFSLVRPIAYPQERFADGAITMGSYLHALHETTPAFTQVPIGAQKIEIVPDVKFARKLAAAREGGAFNMHRAHNIVSAIENHEQPHEIFELQPIPFAEAPVRVEPVEGGYRVDMYFEPNELHAESVVKIAGLIGELALEYGQPLCQTEAEDLYFASALPIKTKIGFLESHELQPSLRKTLHDDPFSFCEEAAFIYQQKIDQNQVESTQNTVADFHMHESAVWFGALKLVVSERISKRVKK